MVLHAIFDPDNIHQVPVSWSHAGRLRSEAAFAALAGVSPSRRPPGRSPAAG
jgi:hypothetical protein